MGSDRARVSYDRKQQYRSVVMQQGRVTLEADWNEAQQITEEQIRREALDFVGPSGTPDNGYQIVLPAAPSSPPFDFSVSGGTMYVGGVRTCLCGSVDYAYQPDWRDYGPEDPDWVDLSTLANSPPADEFVYLYLREQEVSAVEDSDLKDVALGGPDTAQRTRLLQRIARVACQGTDCASGLAGAQTQWQSEGLTFDPSTMRLESWGTLEVGFSGQSTTPNPCQPQAQGGYLGPDNQLIRVQISGIDAATGDPKFLWGFDDASFLYRTAVDSGNSQQLDFQTIPVDAEHQPASGQAVEVLRTAADLNNGGNVAALSGYVITLAQNYDPDTQSIQIPTGYSLPADYLTSNQSPPQQLFLRVWQQEIVFTPGQPAALGNTGLTVTLQTTGNQPFHTGDYWMFAVRPATPQTVYPERFVNGFQPPEGPRLWACPLGVIAWSGEIGTLVSDCRNQFCNLVAACKKQQGCCSILVRPQDVSGTETLQSIVDQAASPTVFVQAATAGASGNNITLQVSNIQLRASPPVFDLTVTEVDVYPGLTSEAIEATIGDQTSGPNTGLAHILTGSVNTKLTPGNDQVVWLTGGQGTAAAGQGAMAQADITDGNHNRVFTLQARNRGSAGNLTSCAISNVNGANFTLTLSWTYTISAVSISTLMASIQNNVSYLIQAAPNSIAPVLPAEGVVQLSGGVDPNTNLGTNAVAAQGGLFGIPGKICLRPGSYYLTTPLLLRPEHSNITIEACGGAVTIAAAKGSENNFLQGLVVLNKANHVTLRGLRFSMPPPIRLIPGSTFFTNVPLEDLEGILAVDADLTTDVAARSLARIYVSVGLRPVGCTGLEIRRCSFYFQNEANSVATISFLEAGILASGPNPGLRLLDNCFQGQLNPRPVSSPLLQVRAGYLLTPSVTITKIERAAVGIGKELRRLEAQESGMMVPALIGDACFEGNTFLGLEHPVLIFAECGAVAFDKNVVKDSYSGIWVIARRSPPNPDTVGWEPPQDFVQDPLFEAALAMAMCFPLPRGYNPPQTITIPTAYSPLSGPPFTAPLQNFMDALLRLEFALINVGAQSIATAELHLVFFGVNNRIATYQPGAYDDDTGPGLAIWGEDSDIFTEVAVNSNIIENCCQPFVPTALVVQFENGVMSGNLLLNDFNSTLAWSLFVAPLGTGIAATDNFFSGQTNVSSI